MLCAQVLTAAAACAAQDPHAAAGPVAEAKAAWDESTGRTWRLTVAPELNGLGKFLWGAQAPAAFTPQDDADWHELARQAFDAARGMFQVADVSLAPDAVRFLELSRIGSSDKVAVTLRQRIGGVPVVGGTVHALFTPQGALLALDSNALPGVERLARRPVANRWEAVTQAREHFAAREGREALSTGEPELVIARDSSGSIVLPRLAWSVELRNEEDPARPAGLRVYVAADDRSGAIVAEDQLIHHQQIQGSVEGWATPGASAGGPGNPPALRRLPHLELTSAAGVAHTDANGDFSFNSAVPLDFTARFRGPWCRVENQGGANHETTLTFAPGLPATLTMNAAQTEFATAEANCYDAVLGIRDWLKSVDPADAALDFQVLALPNVDASCNAYYNGVSITFFREQGGCANAAFSTVIAHEEGHWANDRYGSGNGSDGFGEGNADVLAMYVYDTPIVGAGFYAGGGGFRTGENLRPFCGDGLGGCHHETHLDGEVLMGALWKVRAALNATLGDAAGDLTADSLWVAWMNAFDDGRIQSVIEHHWLALDDDDGNLANGTPNYGDIDAGFLAQGFPGVDLGLIAIDHAPIASTPGESGPYVAAAAIASGVGAPITGGELVYQAENGAAGSVPLAHLGGGNWAGGIPGQAGPSHVRYHLQARDALGNAARLPRAGEFEFGVGLHTPIYFHDFEGSGDEGWTHGSSAGIDDWQRGSPQGNSGDPAAAFSGSQIWGNDLSGAFADYSHNFLLSPAIDCSARTGVRLRFARSLFLGGTADEKARVLVNGTPVWISPPGGVIDSAWQVLDYDVSALADGRSTVRVRFQVETGVFSTSGGWNLDDFELYSLEAPPPGADAIVLSGPLLAPAGSQQSWSFAAAPPHAPFWLLGGSSPAGQFRQGHLFDLGLPARVLASGTTSAAGGGAVTLAIPGAAAGRIGYLEVAALAGGLWQDSNLLTVLIP